MNATTTASEAQQTCFAAYLDNLARAAGRADRRPPTHLVRTGLLPPVEFQTVEPLGARLSPDQLRRLRQSLHHFAADRPLSNPAILDRTSDTVLPASLRHGPGVALVAGDTGCPYQGRHLLDVTRQCRGQLDTLPDPVNNWQGEGDPKQLRWRGPAITPSPQSNRFGHCHLRSGRWS